MKKLLFCVFVLASWNVHAAPFEVGDIPVCTAVTPAAVAVTSTPVNLDVRVLLDGVTQSAGSTIMSLAASYYSSLGITVRSTYQAVNFAGLDGQGLINQAKAYYGGTRPSGIDLVYVLTSKDITDAGASGSGLAGLADCIGGVKYADRAFAVGEAINTPPTSLVLYTLYRDAAAKTAGHEIGHLMGAHHHYANCVESLTAIGDGPCTLMFNFVDTQASQFSLLNGIVVRGHAQAYASP